MELEKLKTGRCLLARERPYVADALWNMTPVEKDMLKVAGIATMGVDKDWNLYHDPTLRWSPTQVGTVLYHEIRHLLFRHHERAEAYKKSHSDLPLNFHELVNVAQDMEINDNEDQVFKDFPWTPVHPSQMGFPVGLIWEEYYELLIKNGKRVEVEGGYKVESKAKGQECGSCAHGQKLPHEDAPGVKRDYEKDLIRRSVARAVEEHAKSRGDIPGDLLRWAHKELNPKVPWERELQSVALRYITEVSGLVNYSYKRPSRRNCFQPDIFMPSFRKPIPLVAFQIDTSGSMEDSGITQAVAEVARVLRLLQAPCIVFSGDAGIAWQGRVTHASQILLKGGGGTDMRVGFEAAAKLRPRPHLFITVTDCETPFPDKAPPFRSIIVNVRPEWGGTTPSWAKRIDVVVGDAA